MKSKKTKLILLIALLTLISFAAASYSESSKAKSNKTASVLITEKIITTLKETVSSTALQTDAPSTERKATTERKTEASAKHTEEETAEEIITEERTKRKSKKGEKYACFEDCVFIGNSRTLDLKDFGLVKNVYASVGVNVSTVYTKCAPGSSRPIMDEIGRRHYDKYFLQFGENECGWPSESTFIAKYKKIIDDIKRKDPRAKIYLQSMIPITASASAKAEFDCTNERIDTFNALIKQLAKDEGVRFIDVAAAFKDIRGCLPDDASYDGVHLNKKSCEKWLDVIEKRM